MYWKGTSTGASTLSNWCTDAELTTPAEALPVDGDDIVLGSGAGNMTWNLNNVTPGSWTQTADYAGTVTFYTGRKNGMSTTLYGVTDDNGETRVFKVSGNCSLQGGTWTHQAQPSFKNLTGKVAYTGGFGVYHIIAEIGGNMSIGSAVVITADGKGFPTSNGSGPGGGSNNCSASHAGWGGKSNGTLQAPYGSFRAPKTIGSSHGTLGGGCIEITVAGALAIANGASFTAKGVAGDYYVGAGGSISIMAGSISGAGSFSARGATTNKNYAGGGGGRISIILTGAGSDFSNFTGTYSTHHFAGTSSKAQQGSGGTTYLETASQGVGGGTLIVDGVTSAWTDRAFAKGTPVTSAESAFPLSKIVLRDDALVIFNGNVSIPSDVHGVAEVYAGSSANILRVNGVEATLPANAAISDYTMSAIEGSTLKLGSEGTGTLTVSGTGKLSVEGATDFRGSLIVASGGEVTHAAGGSYKVDLTVSGNVAVNSGGTISATGKGYAQGSGQGGTAGSKNAGGMHAGRINGNGQHTYKHCYGSIRRPVTHGSGGSNAGASGGGAIKLTVAGNLVNNGTIEANGATVSLYSGAGGSVWVTARTISGSGSFSANGGYCTSKNTSAGGPGSGGRVSLWLTGPTADFSLMTGAVTAYGGYNPNNAADRIGGAGTVYLKSGAQAENEGTLIIRGERSSNYDTELVAQSTDGSAMDVTDTDVGDVVIGDYGRLMLTNVTLTVAGSWTNNNVFTANGNSTVAFTNATKTAHIVGNNAFRHFLCATPGKRLEFDGASSVGATGSFVISGASGNPVVLRGEGNAPWTFSVDASAQTDVEYVDVADCDASGGQTIVARDSAASASQNNTNWNFPSIEAGQTITWTGAASSNWADPGNWDLERVPVDTDRIVIPANTPNAPQLSASAVQMCDLTIAAGAAFYLGGYDLTVTNQTVIAGTLVCAGTETVTCLGNVNMSGATLTVAKSNFVLSGELAQTANLGSVEFWNITVSKTGGSVAFTESFSAKNRVAINASDDCTITFASGKSVACEQFAASGPAGGGLVLSGSGWNLDVAAYANVVNCSVGGCTAGGIKIYPRSSVDLGSNVNWVFGAGASVWTGGANTTNFHDADNWSTGSVPGENDRVVIDSAVTVAIGESVSVKSIELGGGVNAAGLRVRAALEVEEDLNVLTNGTLTLDSPSTAGGVVAVMNGGKITHTANTSAGSYKIDLSCGALFVEQGGKVDAKGVGYPKQTGPGFGDYNQAGSYGGIGDSQSGIGIAKCYGSIFEPVDLGSGGYYTDSYGGGAVKIFAEGEMRIDGVIDATGRDGTDHYAGSGGSIYLSASVLTGIGSIRADGGKPTSSTGGGGGRIAIYETSAVDFSRWEGVVYACGGKGAAEAGTVYLQTAGDRPRGGEIVFSNRNGANATGTPIPASGTNADSARNFSCARLVAKDNSKIVISADMKVRDVSIESSGSYFHCTNHTLRIISRDHKDGKGWARTAITAPEGKIEWAGGFSVSVR